MEEESYLQQLEKLQNEPFKFAVFSGGGAKGAIYSGVHAELKRSGILNGIEAVAGSSAGAITAALIASGISEEDFKKMSSETNLKELLGKGFIVNKDVAPLLQLLRDTISNNISKYIENTDILEVCKIRDNALTKEIDILNKKNDPDLQDQITNLKNTQLKVRDVLNNNGTQIAELHTKAREKGIIKFEDIELLHNIDPVKFKGLVVTATNKKNGELTIFDAKSSPDVEVALACKASSSIPVLFQPVKIKGVEYVDGGYRDNIPQKYFDLNKNDSQNAQINDVTGSGDKIRDAKKQGRTLALAFGSNNDDEANIAVYSSKEKIVNPNRLIKFFTDVVFKFITKVGGDFKYSKEKNQSYSKLRENALNTVILDTKDVGTLSFNAAQKQAEYLYTKGAIQTSRYFENHSVSDNIDNNLAQKEFILKVYEETQNTGTEKWKNKVTPYKEEKLDKILSFCKEDAWQNKDKQQILSSFIELASTERKGSNLNAKTGTMKTIVDLLNHPTTSDEVKQDFNKLLGNKSRTDSKFTDKDFNHIIADKKHLKLDIISANKQNNSTVKNIINNKQSKSTQKHNIQR
jgi:NTE family protein